MSETMMPPNDYERGRLDVRRELTEAVARFNDDDSKGLGDLIDVVSPWLLDLDDDQPKSEAEPHAIATAREYAPSADLLEVRDLRGNVIYSKDERRVEAMHRCVSCGHRWSFPSHEAACNDAHHCGDCHRAAQMRIELAELRAARLRAALTDAKEGHTALCHDLDEWIQTARDAEDAFSDTNVKLAAAQEQLHTSEIQRAAWTDAALRGQEEIARIATLEQSIRDLRDCLVELAHPEDGWPEVHIADAYERSRRLVPDARLQDHDTPKAGA